MKNISTIMLEPKRFAVHDGPGIRTTFFIKGCPLKCIWCHNPESISSAPQMAFIEHKCSNCAECAEVCAANAHIFENGRHIFHHKNCIQCMKCENVCSNKAMKIYGRKISVCEALQIALEDIDFYKESGGGVTLSGGEPLTQSKFTFALFAALKEKSIHTALDTCCFVRQEKLQQSLPLTDIFLVDFKHANPEIHRKLTGQSNEIIKQNLQFLSDNNAKIEIRIPLVPNCNTDNVNIHETGKFLSTLNIETVKLLSYHSMARSKYVSLNMPDTMPITVPPSNEMLAEISDILKSCGLNVKI